MNKNKFTNTMFTKIQTISTMIKDNLNISYMDAITLLYNSKLYEVLEDEKTKMWYYSSYDLYNMFIEEQKTGKFTVYGG